MNNRFQVSGFRFQKIRNRFAFGLKVDSCRLPARTYPFGTGGKAETGFTLVEMIVATALFAIVMVVAVAALLSLTAANRKAQAIQSVMNNLNITLDGMVRNIRMGVDYDGSGSCSNNTGGGANDCTGGGTTFAFKCNPATAVCGTPSTWEYSACGSAICKNGAAITAPDVTINNVLFYVVGTTAGDIVQPKVVIVIKGTAGAQNVRTKSEFHIQATAVQRELDL